MHQQRLISIIAASIACAWAPAASYGQTTTGTTTAPATSVTSTETTTTGTTATTTGATTSTTGTTTTATGTTSTTTSTTAAASESRYLTRLQSQYPTLTSKTNMESLVRGLRSGSAITLTSTQGTTATSTTFTPPTRPMGYGNITRAMTLATRQLAAAGITNPTPQQLQTALMGGTLTTASGTVQMQGVLQLRSQGMGWGQIAHSIGVQPGMGARHGDAVASKTTAGSTTAAGSTTVASSKKTEHSTVSGRGIVTAAGTSATAGSYRGQGSEHRSGGAIIAANGATSHGVVNGSGSGQGGSAGARGNSGKH